MAFPGLVGSAQGVQLCPLHSSCQGGGFSSCPSPQRVFWDFATLFHPPAPASLAAQTLLGEQESYWVLKLILILWGTPALFTAPLQPWCWITPCLSRGVHHFAPSINPLLSAENSSCPCGGTQGRGTTTGGGEQLEIKPRRILPTCLAVPHGPWQPHPPER